MAGINSIYVGPLVDWHNYPTGGLNGQSGFTAYAGSAIEKWNNNHGKRASLYHISGTPSKWGNGTATGGVANLNAFSALQSVLNASHAQGMLPLVDWSPWDWALPTNNYQLRPAAIAVGNWNTYITQWMTDAKAWGKDILIRPFWEMNASGQFPWSFGNTGTWTIPAGNNWGGTWTNSIADVKNAWAQIRSIHDSVGATNVKMAFVANRHANSETATTFALIFPPMSQVDWLGVDNYPDYGQTLGNAMLGTGASSYLGSNYAGLTALDPAKPIIIAETGFRGTNGSSVNVSSITTNGTTWTIVVSGQPGTDTFSAGGNSIALDGMAPSAYNGDWLIATASGTTITVSNTSQPGAVTTLGHAKFVNRVSRASLITTSYESDLPNDMPRVQAISRYDVMNGWPDPDTFPVDVDGNQTGRTDFIAEKNAMGNAHYLAGQQMATDTSTFPWIPFQDQAVSTQGSAGQPTAQERYLDVLRSTTGLVGLWPLTEASAATTVADVSGKGRAGTIVGAVGIGTAGSLVPAETGWSATQFPATPAAGNHIDFGSNADFSIPTTGKWSVTIPFMIPSTPAAQSTIISKAGFSGQLAGAVYEYQGWVSATQIGFTINQTDGSTWASWNVALPSLNVLHLLTISIDTTRTVPIVAYLDGVKQVAGSTITATVGIGAGTAPMFLGEKFDNGSHLPFSANGRLGVPAVYNVALTDESAAEHFAAWSAAPVISAVSPGTPTGTGTTSTWTTGIGGSTWLEYGIAGATTLSTTMVAPVQSLQAYIDATTTGLICMLPANVCFRESVTVSRAMTIEIPSSTRVCGSDDWSISGRSGCTWSGTGPYTSSLAVPAMDSGATADGNIGADWRVTEPCKVFIDSVLQVQLQSGTPTTGQWVFDASRHVQLGTNPTGHRVEVVTRQVIFTVTASNVTIQSATVGQYAQVEHCGSSYQRGAINLLNDSVNTLTLSGLRVAWTHAYAISIQGNNTGHVVDGCWTYETGQGPLNGGSTGVWGSQVRSGTITVRNSLMERNNINRGWTGGWDAGLKIVCRVGSLLERNYFRDFNSIGIWLDNDGNGASSCTTQDNDFNNTAGAAIFYEIQGEGATQSYIRRNKISKAGWGSGQVSGGWRFDAGILLSSSVYVDVADNIVAWSKYAYSFIWKNRSEVATNSATHITAENNVAIHQWGSLAFSVAATSDSAGMTETATDNTTNGTPFIGWLDPDNTTTSALFSDTTNTGTGWQVWASTDGTTAIADATGNTRFAYNNVESNSAATFSATRWGSSTTTLTTTAEANMLNGTADSAGFTGQFLDGVAMPATYAGSGSWPITAYGTVTPLQPLRATSHSVTLTGLTAGTTYHYRVHSRNAAGTEAVSADATFTTVGTTQTILYVMVV